MAYGRLVKSPTKRTDGGTMRTIRFAQAGLAVVALSLAACGGDGGSQTDESAGIREDVLIKTHLTFSDSGEGSGDVASGSVIGDEPFCEGGTFSDAPGQAGDVVKTLDCEDGTLEVRFTPRSQEKNKESGPWTVGEGSGAYEGVVGDGQMSVTFESRDRGEETFRGTVTR